MTLEEIAAAAIDQMLGVRVEAGIVQSAIEIYNESTTTPGHLARAAYATKVLGNPGAYSGPWLWALASQGMTDQSTDAEILSAISSVWNALAGA